ncbi:hypothetical protein ACOSQ3_023315 [Xanthoceras sorbifolium]
MDSLNPWRLMNPWSFPARNFVALCGGEERVGGDRKSTEKLLGSSSVLRSTKNREVSGFFIDRRFMQKKNFFLLNWFFDR